MSQVQQGEYIDLYRTTDGLTLKLTNAGREALQEYVLATDPIEWTKSPDEILWSLLEDYLERGWETIRPEEIGALTACNIITDEAERNEYGHLLNIGEVYAFADYAVKLEIEELYRHGFCVFMAA